jgi:hypothetical protein
MVVSTPVRMPVGQRAVIGLEVGVEADAFDTVDSVVSE